ncbi:MAG: GxxExxY protein [Mariprofundus sp.]|nr:GxxExxY protein [Mariprofundus sp.]
MQKLEPQGHAESTNLSQQIIDAACHVPSALGPGLLESAYEHCLCYELGKRDILAIRQLQLPVLYDGHQIEAGYRIDMMVDNQLIVEIETADTLLALHETQLLTYLKLANKQVGLLINFNLRSLKNSIKRMVHNLSINVIIKECMMSPLTRIHSAERCLLCDLQDAQMPQAHGYAGAAGETS